MNGDSLASECMNTILSTTRLNSAQPNWQFGRVESYDSLTTKYTTADDCS